MNFLVQLVSLIWGGAVGLLLVQMQQYMAEQRGLDSKISPIAKTTLCGATALLFCLLVWNSTSWVHLLLRWGTAALCCLAASFDLHYRRIPNGSLAALLFLGMLSQVLGCAQSGLLSAFAGFAVCGVLFFVPFLFGKSVGAGDVKLAMVIGFCAGLTGSLGVLVWMGLLIIGYTILARGTMLQLLQRWVPMAPFVTTAYMLFLIR